MEYKAGLDALGLQIYIAFMGEWTRSERERVDILPDSEVGEWRSLPSHINKFLLDPVLEDKDVSSPILGRPWLDMVVQSKVDMIFKEKMKAELFAPSYNSDFSVMNEWLNFMIGEKKFKVGMSPITVCLAENVPSNWLCIVCSVELTIK